MNNLSEKIVNLKKQKNAVILAHYYVKAEIQDIADFIGDSLQLAYKASQTTAEIIVFAGVKFMAETAKIISPDKKVLIPDKYSFCPLASSMQAAKLKDFKQKNPDYFVVNYINTTAEVKTLSDLVCTSSNAVEIIKSLPEDTKILFGPDKNLGNYVKSQVKHKIMVWDGFCPVHENFSAHKLSLLKRQYPKAKVLVHPEANKDVLLQADVIGSTSKIIKFASESVDNQFIIATEPGVIHKMQKDNPNKKFIPLPPVYDEPESICVNMKKHSLEKLYEALKNEQFEVTLSPEIIEKAAKPINRMMEISEKLGLLKK